MNIEYGVGLDNKYASLESFRSGKLEKQGTIPQTPPMKEDKVEVSAKPEGAEQKPEKKGIIRGFKDVVGSVKKFFISVGEYTKGTVKGLFYGGIAAGGVLSADAIRNGYKVVKAANESGAANQAAKAVKLLSWKGKVAAGIAGVAVLGYQLFKSSLNVSEKGADVDHRWGTGHKQG